MLLPDETLQIADRVRVVCAQVPELCVERSVGPDGTLDLPVLGPVAAALRRPDDLARELSARLPRLGRPAEVALVLLGGARDEVRIVGAIARPLRLYAPNGILRERLLAVAKPTADADLALLAPRRRIPPGETLVVLSAPVERKISLLGAVAKPQILPPTEGLSLADALERAGGLTAHANREAVLLERNGETIPLALPRDAGFPLRPGDKVTVGLLADRHYVIVKGLVARPGSVEYAPGMTATRALAAAGGVLDAARGGTLVWLTGAKTYRLSLAFLFARRIPDPVLGAEDSIIVESGKP